MAIDRYNDDFTDYFYDLPDIPDYEEDARVNEEFIPVSFRLFSELNDEHKLEHLYILLNLIYSDLLTIKEVVKKGG